MDALTRRQFDRAMFAKDRTLAIRVGDYASRDVKEASFEYGYIKGDTYKPGGTCAGSGKITFTSIITTFNKLDILHPEIGLLVGNTYQWVKMGEYFINDIEIDRNRNTTTLELMDGMFKLNREYVTDLHFPAEVREVIQEICLKTGIELANDYFGISAMRYHVEQIPEGKKLSFRDMLSAMTQMIGMSCFFNREGKMEIRDLTESNITINADSYFLHGLTKSEIEYQIAGITCKTDKKSLTVGMKTGRSLELDNVFMTQSALNDLYYKLKNLTYYPYNLNYQGHLLLEVGQWVTIQTNKKETFKVPVLSQSFTFKGGLRGRISADSKAGNDTQYSYEGTITKQIKQQDGIEAKIQAQIEAADAAFDAEFKKRKKEIDDGIELAKAKAEEVKQELSDIINQRFDSFDNGPLKEAKRKAEEALKNAGASSSLAQEAKQIGLDSIARLEAFKSQTTNAQTALSGDLDALKLTVTSEVNQASEYRRTTIEALSRMTGQMNGFATKSEVKQGIDGLTQTFAKMKVGGRNYYRNSDKLVTRPRFIQFDVYPYLTADNIGEDWTFSFDLKINETGTVRQLHFYHYQRNGLAIGVNTFFNPSKEWQRYSFTAKVVQGGTNPAYAKGAMAIYDHAGDNDISIRNVKFEKGTLATDWSPAPEDTEGLITEAKATFERTAQELRTDLSAIQEYVNKDGQRQEALQRYTREESAKQATAVREIVAKDYVGKATYQETVKAIENKFEAITNPQNGSIATQIATYKNAVDGRFADITSLIAGKANQTDFQRVKETSQLYERILGNTENGIADKVARMAMTNQLFQVEVGKAVQKGRNYYRDSEKIQTKTRFFAFPLHPYLTQENVGETWTLSFDLKINEGGEIRPLHFYHYQTNRFGIKASGDVTPSREWQRFTFTGPVIFPNDDPRYSRGEMALYDFAGNNNYSVRRIKFERGSVATDYKEAPEDTEEAIRTVQTQLAGSWAVQNINSAGDIISGINLGANGHNRITGKLTHITGDTLIDNAVIKSAMVDKLKTANFEAGSVTTTILDAEAVTAEKVRFDDAFIRKMIANEAFIEQLTSKRIFATKVESVISRSTVLEGYKGWIGGFQLGTHDSGSGRWLTGRNHFSVGMGDGEGGSGQTALWVNWGGNWSEPGYYAWFVKNNGKMYCYNTAEFWKTPIVHGDLKVTGKIVYDGGAWIYSNGYEKIGRSSKDYFYLEKANGVREWFPAWNDASDRRLKSNIQESSVSGIDIINRLKTYSYRKEFNNEVEDISCGIMAQDVQKYAPDAFRESPDGVYTYNTFALVPYLIKAIQELNQKIEKMEKTIA